MGVSSFTKACCLIAALCAPAALAKKKKSKRAPAEEILTGLTTIKGGCEDGEGKLAERVKYGDKVKILLTAYVDKGTEFLNSPSIENEFIIGRHNVPAVNEAILGSCVDEARKFMAHLGKNRGALAYVVELKEIIQKGVLRPKEAKKKPGKDSIKDSDFEL